MKKLAMLLAVCLTLTMFSGPGYTEDELSPEGIALLPNDVLTEAEGQIELDGGGEALLPEEDDSALLLDGDALALTTLDGALEVAELIDAQDEQTQTAPQTQAEAPHVDPQGPRLAANTLTLGVGERYSLAGELPEGVEGGITYASSDTAIAKVSATGRVTAVAVGFATVTAIAGSGAYSECFVEVRQAPDKVAFGAKRVEIGKGEHYETLRVIVGSDEAAFAGSYTLKSSDSGVVKIKANNVLKGVKVGTATVTAETYNGKKAICSVSVVKAPTSVKVKVDKALLGVGEYGSAFSELPEGTAGQVRYTSEDPAVLEVDPQTGMLLGLAPGETRVCASTYNGKKGYVDITVAAAPTALSFDADVLMLGVGMRLPVAARVNEGAAGGITYAVDDAGVAALDGDVLKGVAKGKAVLTATAYNGVTASCPIEVTAAPKKVKLPHSKLEIGVQQKVVLTPDTGDRASTFTYSTSNKKIARVDADGTVTGVKHGECTVTVKTYNGKKCTLKVKVLKAPSKVTIAPERLELDVGESAALSCSFPKGTAAGVTYESSDPSVAAVDAQTGVVTGVAGGECQVVATTVNGKQATAQVVVHKPTEWLNLPEKDLVIGVEQAWPLTVEQSPDANSKLFFESENTAVAIVSDEGVITGVAKGKTTVIVSANGGALTAQVSVKVVAAPKWVKLPQSEASLNVGQTLQLEPTLPNKTAASFHYTSSNEAVASVDQAGLVTALAQGEAEISVFTHNGKSAKLTLSVVDPLFPTKVKLTNFPESMLAGETLQLEWSVTPKDAVADLEWQTSNADIAYVDEAGVLHALALGYATITATSRRNPEIVLNFKLSVETENVTLTIPIRITGTSGISRNLQRIDAIRTSAIGQIDALEENGTISGTDASKRRRMVNNAFGDYAFPWMTPSKQKYWKAANSEGGVKDFKPGQVYYGVPYISGSGSNRAYNVPKLLKENRFYDSGEGYYLLNRDNLKNGKYCGNDCSCFVDAAIWGTDSSHSNDRTKEIAKSSAYKTIKGYSTMRTGDLICLGGHHVVMFLYYANSDKSKIMIIENGGIEPGTNTVHCMIMNLKWYSSRGYKVRRLKSLG